MALVSGQSVSSFGELSTMPVAYAELSPGAEDSDDDYAYVSSLAEQIAHALMLDDDEEPPVTQPSPSFHPEMRHHRYEGTAWSCTSPHPDQEFESTSAEMKYPVSNLALACQGNGPAEWDCCLYTLSLQQTSKQLFTLYTSQLDLKYNHQFQEWNATQLDRNLVAAYAPKIWDLTPQESRSTVYHSVSSVRKESIGTGVFLPKIVNMGPHYRKKAGFSSPRSGFAPRHKC